CAGAQASSEPPPAEPPLQERAYEGDDDEIEVGDHAQDSCGSDAFFSWTPTRLESRGHGDAAPPTNLAPHTPAAPGSQFAVNPENQLSLRVLRNAPHLCAAQVFLAPVRPRGPTTLG